MSDIRRGDEFQNILATKCHRGERRRAAEQTEHRNRWSERDRPRPGMRQDRTVQTQWSDEKLRAQPHSTVRARGRRASDVMTHATTWPETPLLSLDRHVAPPLILYPAAGKSWRHRIRNSILCRCGDRIGIRRLAADRRHKGSRTPTPRTVKPWRELARAPARIVAYRGSNGPLLLTKQAQHSTGQYYPFVCIFQCLRWLEVVKAVVTCTS